MYKPTTMRKKKRIRVQVNGKWVGIGGDVTINQAPPKLPITIKEANQKEYEAAFKAGVTGIEKKSAKKYKSVRSYRVKTDNDVQTPVTNTESSPRPEEDQQVL